MGKLIIRSHEEFEKHVGQELGVSEYMTITQEQINKFADATFDHQWIHVDEERAKTEGAFGSTIAHGYLTLSLLAYMWDQIIQVENIKMLVNYGIESFRFNQPVLVNSRIRTRVVLKSVTNLRGISKIQLNVTMEIEGNRKSAYEGTITFLYHFI
ncbi:MAG: MaoC family dehydratase [Bacteroidota bacterium]|nr:MaoC family dehydratase [Bacteroidota bacterium]MDP2112820.1 MaoC family dehydratase [Bacteroidota bacterium]MDP3435276.1 MaoC family dehydratase [Bacteroidota bacterium]